jgi:hypothetical protein
MSGEQLVDVSYRGLSVGTSVALRDFGPSTAYLEVESPMPVGSVVDVTNDSGDGFSARVIHVREKTDSAPNAGMRISVEELPASVQGWWQSQVSQEDPPVAAAPPPPAPEPEPEPEAAPESEAAPPEAVPEEVPDNATPQRTQVMAAVDISQIEALGATVSSEEFAAREAEAAAAVAEPEPEPELDDNGKKKKRRRKKKRKKD